MATNIVAYAFKIGAVIAIPAIIGCHRRTYYTPPPIDGVHFDAGASVVADTLVVTGRAANTSHKYIEIEFDQCGSRPSDFSVHLVQGRRSWDSRVWETQRVNAAADSAGQIRQVCAGGVLSTQSKPGAVMPYVLRTPLARIFGDSLSAGRYRVTADLVINGRLIKGLNAGEVELPPPNTR